MLIYWQRAKFISFINSSNMSWHHFIHWETNTRENIYCHWSWRLLCISWFFVVCVVCPISLALSAGYTAVVLVSHFKERWCQTPWSSEEKASFLIDGLGKLAEMQSTLSVKFKLSVIDSLFKCCFMFACKALIIGLKIHNHTQAIYKLSC